MREEGEAAQDDPGPEQAGGDCQEEDLEEAALDERELKGLEDDPSLMRMNLVCIWLGQFVQDRFEQSHQSK
jgi:hypothetical protein